MKTRLSLFILFYSTFDNAKSSEFGGAAAASQTKAVPFEAVQELRSTTDAQHVRAGTTSEGVGRGELKKERKTGLVQSFGLPPGP